MSTETDTLDEIFSDPAGVNKHRPRHIFELPAQYVLMMKKTFEFMLKMQNRIEAGIHSPWLPSSQAAKYLGVSKSHLLHNLKDKIPYSKSEEGQIIVFHINDLDEYWKSRRRN